MSAWQLADDWLTTAWQLPNDCPMTEQENCNNQITTWFTVFASKLLNNDENITTTSTSSNCTETLNRVERGAHSKMLQWKQCYPATFTGFFQVAGKNSDTSGKPITAFSCMVPFLLCFCSVHYPALQNSFKQKDWALVTDFNTLTVGFWCHGIAQKFFRMFNISFDTWWKVVPSKSFSDPTSPFRVTC